MRRFLTSLAAIGLLSGMVGCVHTAGKCDCCGENHGCDCAHGYNGAGNGYIAPVAPATPAEPLKEMPKENGAPVNPPMTEEK